MALVKYSTARPGLAVPFFCVKLFGDWEWSADIYCVAYVHWSSDGDRSSYGNGMSHIYRMTNVHRPPYFGSAICICDRDGVADINNTSDINRVCDIDRMRYIYRSCDIHRMRDVNDVTNVDRVSDMYRAAHRNRIADGNRVANRNGPTDVRRVSDRNGIRYVRGLFEPRRVSKVRRLGVVRLEACAIPAWHVEIFRGGYRRSYKHYYGEK